MKVNCKTKNIGIKGIKKPKSSGRINHSVEEWTSIIASIKKRDAERIEKEKNFKIR